MNLLRKIDGAKFIRVNYSTKKVYVWFGGGRIFGYDYEGNEVETHECNQVDKCMWDVMEPLLKQNAPQIYPSDSITAD